MRTILFILLSCVLKRKVEADSGRFHATRRRVYIFIVYGGDCPIRNGPVLFLNPHYCLDFIPGFIVFL